MAEICRDGDEEPAGEPRPQHLGQSHYHPPTSQPVLVRMALIYCAVTSGGDGRFMWGIHSIKNKKNTQQSIGELVGKVSTLNAAEDCSPTEGSFSAKEAKLFIKLLMHK